MGKSNLKLLLALSNPMVIGYFYSFILSSEALREASVFQDPPNGAAIGSLFPDSRAAFFQAGISSSFLWS